VSLTVLSVAYPLAPVGPDAAGGAEQVLMQLDRALMEAGHRSIVVAQEGSRTAGTLVAVPAERGALDAVKPRAWEAHRRAIASALQRWPIDLVHLHGLDFHAYLPARGVPALVTLHVPLSWYAPEALRPERPDTWLNCVSQAQHETWPKTPNLLPPIENGVPIDSLTARHAKRRFAMFLGRICPEKGVHLAIEAAKRADVALVIAGEVFGYEGHRRYFEDEILPRLDARRRFIGPVGFVRKRRLLTAAQCLLVSSVVPETSSLVAREALACGTPVVGFRTGALPQTIEHGRTGFLVDTVDEMADAIGSTSALDPDLCRAVARQCFSLHAMTKRYLDVYGRLAHARAHRAVPLDGAA
jgi:glycosyltransferase involved in cell wall biosynthesis